MTLVQKPKKILQDVTGVLLLDKPFGLSSNTALQKVKRLFNAKKAGHTGSLDPLATGMLPICFGKATKFCQYLLATDKTYRVTITFGKQTTTGDREGEIIAEKPVPDNLSQLLIDIIPKFLGEQTQIPPMYSALKKDGKPLYELARAGITIEREARKIHIYDLQLIQCENHSAVLQVHCSKGTYVRTLAEDLATAIGTCGFVSALHRVSIGNFLESQMISLDDLEKALAITSNKLNIQENDLIIASQASNTALNNHLIPMKQLFSAWPAMVVSAFDFTILKSGQSINIPENSHNSQWISLQNQSLQFIGIAEKIASDQIILRKSV